MSKFRVHVEEVLDDGTVKPFDCPGLGPMEGEGILILCITDDEEKMHIEGTVQRLSVNDIAVALNHNDVLKKAARMAAVKGFLSLDKDDDDDDDEGGGSKQCRLFNMRFSGRVKPTNG